MKNSTSSFIYQAAWRQLAVASLCCVSSLAWAAGKTYTLDADFALGVLDGVNYDAPNSDQLQLNAVGTTFPVAWIANAGEDTVSKFDTNLNKEVARYRTWFGPAGQPGYFNHLGNAYAGPAPSRTAVDINGNAYVLNRHFSQGTSSAGVVLKILAEGFIDRNGNGVMDTSADSDDDGIIDNTEMMPLADTNGNGIIDESEIQDERIAWVKRVPDGIAAPLRPTGVLGRAMCIGTDGNLWVGLFNDRTYYKISSADGSTITGPVSTTPTAGQPNAGSWTPYGCLIDASGTLWSASLSGVLGKITNTQSDTGPYTVSSFASSFNYGIALGNGKVYLGSANQQFDPATNTYSAIPNMNVGSSGIVVDGGGNIIAGSSTVRKVAPDGTLLWQAPLQAGGSSSVGIQVDANNDVLQIGFTSAGRIQKYRGTDGAPLGVFPVGNMPYTYSDATGLVARNVTNPTGTWTVVYDSGNSGTAWDNINWNDLTPADTSVQVAFRAAETQAGLALVSYQPTTKGSALASSGRFIQVQSRLNGNEQGQSPILFDLTINAVDAGCDVDGNGATDSVDVALVRAGIGQTPLPGDVRDQNGDGKITVNDARLCALKCSLPRCAVAP
ncbi:hypothetical protein [Rheinheimera nanhaiensis]|uniref:Dockerin domain-containing protein n=1 Tax=Rheinheimera nanhaiensis E407-8 TaxID=562729 RepID=I1DVU0_9GAMM|nr:hypothetical protein [Rheinheimera nanhaiensis]GAB58168.1 hypothetical protein RNAN_1139 [Rheinheimera nanhaiensis E407-8]